MKTPATVPARRGRAALHGLHAAGLVVLAGALPLARAAAPISLPAADAQGRIAVSPAEQAYRGVRTLTVAAAGAVPSPARPAIVRAAPGASWQVTAQLDGRLLPPPEGFPAPGSRIEAGELLAYLMPTPTLSQRSRLAAEQADAERDLAIAKLKLEQFERGYGGRASIMKDPSSPTLLPQLEAEREGGEKRRQALEQGYGNRSAVFSARDGVLLGAPLAQGRIVRTGDPLFELYDAQRLWLELLDAAEVCAADASANAGAAQTDLQGVASDGRWLALRCVGTAPALFAASVVTHLDLIEGGEGLSPGARLAVRLQPASAGDCVTLPPTALGPAQDGWAGVWVRSGIGHFVARRVPITARTDAGACAGHLLPGEQVVTAGLPPPAMQPPSPSETD